MLEFGLVQQEQSFLHETIQTDMTMETVLVHAVPQIDSNEPSPVRKPPAQKLTPVNFESQTDQKTERSKRNRSIIEQHAYPKCLNEDDEESQRTVVVFTNKQTNVQGNSISFGLK